MNAVEGNFSAESIPGVLAAAAALATAPAKPTFVPPIPLGSDVQRDGLIYDLIGRDEINGNLLVRFGDLYFWEPPAGFKVV